jgi:hypothetical protein
MLTLYATVIIPEVGQAVQPYCLGKGEMRRPRRKIVGKTWTRLTLIDPSLTLYATVIIPEVGQAVQPYCLGGGEMQYQPFQHI